MTRKWTCDRHGNWRQVWVEVVREGGRLVEVVAVADATATGRKAA